MSELLDTLLKDWLERRAAAGRAPRPDLEAAAVITVAAHAVGELRRLCDLWGLRLNATPGTGGWTVLRIDGPALAVQGLAEITARGGRR
jgi:hypothetical protein